jgi:error-prone DNA polymerase
MLNNWPLGFYHPATLVKDAQRHGLRVLPIDVTRSSWKCTLEEGVKVLRGYAVRGSEEEPLTASTLTPNTLSLRLGLRYAAGLREEAGKRIEAARAKAPFASIADVAARAALRSDELETLAHIGAFAALGLTRRAALWQAAALPREPLFTARHFTNAAPRTDPPPTQSSVLGPRSSSPLLEMSLLERTLADYKGTGMTVGPHLMRHLRETLAAEGVLCAADLPRQPDGAWVEVAGLVIVRQRPGTAKGFCFLTLEDETGICNAVVVPDMFQKHRTLIHTASLLAVAGPLQVACPEPGRRVDGVIHVRARRFRPLALPRQTITQTGHGYRMRVTPEDEETSLSPSHDFR